MKTAVESSRYCLRKAVIISISKLLCIAERMVIVLRARVITPLALPLRVFQANVHIEKLNLAGNWMEAIGGIHIAHMLLENEYISELVSCIFTITISVTVIVVLVVSVVSNSIVHLIVTFVVVFIDIIAVLIEIVVIISTSLSL